MGTDHLTRVAPTKRNSTVTQTHTDKTDAPPANTCAPFDCINQEDLRQIQSISPECNELKSAYDACFNEWFGTKFLLGKDSDMSPCTELLNQYTACVKAAFTRLKIAISPTDCPPLPQSKDPAIHPHLHVTVSKDK